MNIEQGIKVAKHVVGDEGAAAAVLTTARVARTAKRVAKGVKDGIDAATRAGQTEGQPKSLEATAATSTGGASGLSAALQGALVAFRQGAGTPVAVSPETDEAMARVADKVRGTSLVVVKQVGQLATVAEGIVPRPVGVASRILGGRATTGDIASATGFLERVHGGLGGFAKRKAFELVLRRMKDNPDPRVFTLLDAFSNSCEECLKALRSISVAIRDMKIGSATALEVIDLFKDIKGKPNAHFRLEALKVLRDHIESRAAAAEIVKGFAPDDEAGRCDENARYDALKVLVERYNGMTADEICAFLELFKDQRARARKLVNSKLTEPEKVGQIDALFEAKPSILAAPEVAKLREGVTSLLGTAGATGKAIFEGFMAGARKKSP